MHLYIIPRGVKHDYDKFINDLSHTYLPYRFPDKDGIIKEGVVQMNVKPLQVYEVIFPEEVKDIVLNTLLQGSTGIADGCKKYSWYIKFIKKILGLDPIPEYKKDRMFPLYHDNVECTGIGLKKDYWINPQTKEKIDNPTEEQKKYMFEGL